MNGDAAAGQPINSNSPAGQASNISRTQPVGSDNNRGHTTSVAVPGSMSDPVDVIIEKLLR